ncbi:MAG: transposase [Planctomycetes bacterium]|nr:transposase [Planctomycetota bacterium]
MSTFCRFLSQNPPANDANCVRHYESKWELNESEILHCLKRGFLWRIFYGYATGVRSSRKLAERCISDHTYIYLMQSYTPDHRTISDFRKNNLKEIGKYFVDIVRIFSTLGYSHVGKIHRWDKAQRQCLSEADE